MDLIDLRKMIDTTDNKIMENYIERAKLVAMVADYKKANNIAILNENRENEVINALIEKFGEAYKQDIISLYTNIMGISKLRQARANRDITIESLLQLSSSSFKGKEKGLKVALQGVDGSYSTLAAKSMFDTPQLFYKKSFVEVFQEVAKGKADFGVIPIENSTAGSVNEVYDLLAEYRLFIAKAKKERIEHCLLGAQDAYIGDIKTVLSHSQALYQCKDYLRKNDIKGIDRPNTAIAAEEVSNNNDKTIGAIASERAATLYGLGVLEKGIQDESHNYTRFIAVSRENIIQIDGNKISLVVSLEHRKGALYGLLNIIASYGINMTKLESRPVSGSNFEFLFYFDFEGNVMEGNVENMLFDIYEYSQRVLYLGGYLEV